jgi:hypothetical protein
MQRRRSFDGPSLDASHPAGKLKTPPTPHSSVSARITSPVPSSVRTTAPSQPPARGTLPKINTAPVPYPRGGRQIGAEPLLLRRSASIERNNYKTEGNASSNDTVLCVASEWMSAHKWCILLGWVALGGVDWCWIIAIYIFILDQPQKDKKRHHFFRLGKKKSNDPINQSIN